MQLLNRLSYLIKTVGMIAGSIALIGIVVGLHFQILPERNLFIRYSEMGFFSFCIPVLLGEVWQRLKVAKYSVAHLKIVLGLASAGLIIFLYMAFLDGGILNIQFLAVILLLVTILALVSVGTETFRRTVVMRTGRIARS
jgi:hypothetical protein